MKNNKLYLFFFILSGFFLSCKNHTTVSNADFVAVEDDHFVVAGDTFFPLMLNYTVSFQSKKDQFIVAPFIYYDSAGHADAVGEKAVKEQLLAHFGLIKDMGFNSLRICFDRIIDDDDGRYYYKADRNFYLDDKKDREAIFRGLDQLIKVADEKGLRIMLLIKPPFEKKSDLQLFTIELLEHFKNCPTLFAYDFMNEPLYFDTCKYRDKLESVDIVRQWKQMMAEHAPNQLFTIGFAEPIETFEWDCSLLPVDFVEFHTYHPLRVPSEIYWYAHYCGKPWMIGETNLPADNDSISYEEQAQFVREAYQITRDAGGCGFGLWEYQEVPIYPYEARHTAILRHGGEIKTQHSKDFTIKGTMKPVAHLIADLEKNYTPRPFQQPINYYNMLGYKNIRIKGRVLCTETGEGIEGAVIRGWNENWSVGMNTYSDEDGYFELYSNDVCKHFEISAPGHSTMLFDRDINFMPLSNHADDISNLPAKELEYQQISYKPFVTKDIPDNEFFKVMNFDTDHFHQAQWEGNLGIIKLEKLPTNF